MKRVTELCGLLLDVCDLEEWKLLLLLHSNVGDQTPDSSVPILDSEVPDLFSPKL